MTQAEFKAQMESIDEQIRALRRRRSNLEKSFIEEHKDEYPMGAMVLVHYADGYPDECGIVIGHTIEDYKLRPLLAKAKKDGTAHATAKLWYGHKSTLKVIERYTKC